VRFLHLGFIGAALAAAACGSSTSPAPSPASEPASPATAVAQTMVQTIDAQTNAVATGVTASGDGLQISTTPSGGIRLVADSASSPTWPVAFQGGGFLNRQTSVRVPGPDAVVSLIPSAFDLTSFDQMFRTPFLQRWVSAPPLVLERRIVQYVSETADSEPAVGTLMSDAEYASLVADLTWALPQLTGGTFQDFASVTSRTSSGSNVFLSTPGQITVVFVEGLHLATGFQGYSRWRYQNDGTVTAGVVTLDHSFSQYSGSPFVRPLRAHELGHALGYNHVTGRTSIMNATVTILQPTQWDLDAARIAFGRHPGNRSPDNDLSGISTNAVHGPVWTDWIR
jgi:hypothetical protein